MLGCQSVNGVGPKCRYQLNNRVCALENSSMRPIVGGKLECTRYTRLPLRADGHMRLIVELDQ